MKLLLDEMWSPEIAQQLRQRGYNVIAIAEETTLRGMSDRAVFELAQREGYAIVTDNVDDFMPLAASAVLREHNHAGLILTTNRKYPRGTTATIGRMVAALESLLSSGIPLENVRYWL